MTYLEHFNLNEKPFKQSPDPRFMWLGEAHKKAWAILHSGVLSRRGFTLLTGDVGTGKTTVINKLVQGLDESVLVARISDPSLDLLDFYKVLAFQFGLKGDFRTKGDFLIELNLFLHRRHRYGKNVVVIVDEAQRLSDALLEEIRLLTNIERPDEKLINIVLVGQDELLEKLARNANRALRQRITTRYALGPLAEQEVGEVIRYRLQVAGAQEQIFTPEAIGMITAYSRGNPRLINLVCDLALTMAFVQKKHHVDDAIAGQCVKRLTAMLVPAAKKDQGAGIGADAPASPWDKPRPVQKNHDTRKEGDNQPAPPPASVSRRRGLLAGAAVAVFILLVLGAAYFSRPQRSERFIVSQAPSQPVDTQHVSPPDPGNGGADPEAAPQPPPGAMPVSSDEATSAVTPAALDEGEQDPGDTIASVGEAGPEDAGGPTISGKAIADVDGRATDATPAETAPAQAASLPAEKTVIHFPYNSNQISEEAFRELDRLAELTRRHPGTRLVITGYTDGLGDRAYNINVSQFRADAIKSYFVGRGIGADRITATGLGPANPVAPDDTYHGRSQNRRVEIELVVAE